MVRTDDKIKSYTNEWHVPLCSTWCEVPGLWCKACFCPCCVAYMTRDRLVPLTQYYRCCAGLYCGDCKYCGGPGLCEACPRFCMATETVFCCWCAIFANRAIIQDKWQIKNTKCEECMILTTCVVGWVTCILSLFVPIGDEISCCLDIAYLMFSACLQSQAEAELNYREHAADNDKFSSVSSDLKI